ncbi:MAG: hypothetical protein MK233_00320 [Candidatus Poseidoniales archaeon]|nr:hypothetical protein [Candidatus Poseidoniales archaeon]
MFKMPVGETVEDGIDLSVSQGSFPFDFGCISYSRPRARVACGHRLICAGAAVGALCEEQKGKRRFLAGNAAEEMLAEMEAGDGLKATGTMWTRRQFESVARNLLEAFSDTTALGTLLPTPRIEGHIPTRDLSLLIEKLASSEVSRGAAAVEDGLLVHSAGDLPLDSEAFAALVQTHLEALVALGAQMDMSRPLSTSIALPDGSLLIAPAGDSAIAVWTDSEADHTAMLANAAALLRTPTAVEDLVEEGEPLPDGVIVKESKGGVDQLISHLRSAADEHTTGYLESQPVEGEAIAITLISGVPVGIRATGVNSVEVAVMSATNAGNTLRLHRLDRVMQLVLRASTVADWSLSGFADQIASCRTRSENRLELLKGRLDALFGFELGMEGMLSERSDWKLVEDADAVAALPGTTRAQLLGPALGELRMQIERLEGDVTRIKKEKARADSRTKAANAERDELKTDISATRELLEEGRDARTELSNRLDESQLRIREEQVNSEEQGARAERLARRVTELEHQVTHRAEELASAIGEMDSRQQLLEALEGLLTEEARAKSELEAAEARLVEVRRNLDDDERMQRVLNEQVSAQRERHRKAEAQVNELERQREARRADLDQVDSEMHTCRRLLEEERMRTAEMDRKHTLMQTELRELMSERRQLMRELGDLDSRRGSAEAELGALIEQAEDLQDAHELALVDIAEADKIRARLASEPLAQALLGDESGLSQLEPVLDRMTAAHSRGYSVALLDRAVERGLQIIQHTVDEVAQTPRYLLSTEVMELLQRQAPETADTVRGLTRWSVQNRLENRLAETVAHVVLDLENLLDEYEESVTMLMQLREVLRQMHELGLPTEDIAPLEAVSHMPEALPQISREVRRLLRQTLDAIYLEADQRDRGEAATLDDTVEVLEQLMQRLDTSGLTGETPMGSLWTFQSSGMLPFEKHVLTEVERPEINKAAIAQMNPVEADEEESVGATPTQVDASDTSQTWEPIAEPADRDGIDLTSRVTAGLAPAEVLGDPGELDDISRLELELANLDAAAAERSDTIDGVPPPAEPAARDTLTSHEDALSALDI